MCKIWAEECDNCNNHTGRFNIIELCEPYKKANDDKHKWISGHPNKISIACSSRFDNKLIPVGDYKCPHCHPPTPASNSSGSVPEKHGSRPRIHKIADHIEIHEELVQLAEEVAHIRCAGNVQGIVDGVMKELGLDRFQLWARDSICISVLTPGMDQSSGADIDMDTLLTGK